MRPTRQLIPGARYHVIAKANRGEFILESPKIKHLLLRTLRQAKQRYRFVVESICIMSNHVHMIVLPRKGVSLSLIMQWFLGVFAIRLNRHLKLHGHVWYDRFRSFILHTFAQYRRTYDYIRDNPVTAGIVTDASQYEYGPDSLRRSRWRGVLGPPWRRARLD